MTQEQATKNAERLRDEIFDYLLSRGWKCRKSLCWTRKRPGSMREYASATAALGLQLREDGAGLVCCPTKKR